jgi:hypothetical protein
MLPQTLKIQAFQTIFVERILLIINQISHSTLMKLYYSFYQENLFYTKSLTRQQISRKLFQEAEQRVFISHLLNNEKGFQCRENREKKKSVHDLRQTLYISFNSNSIKLNTMRSNQILICHGIMDPFLNLVCAMN